MGRRIFSAEKRLTLVEQVSNKLREAIRSGKLKPGERLIEADLANDMQIGRNAIREAIRYLEKEGLVVTKPFKGSHITEMTEQDLKEIYALRSVLETLAISILIKDLDDKKINKLEQAVNYMKKAAENSNHIEQIINSDLNFHQTICELSGNRRLLNAWTDLSYQLKGFIATDVKLHLSKGPQETFALHYKILESIKLREAHLAVSQMKKVIQRGYKNACIFLKRKERKHN